MTMPHTRGLGGANTPRTLLALSLAVMVVVSMSVGGAAADDTDTPTLLPSSRFGFYLHVYQQPAAVIFQVRRIRDLFPDSPIYIMSDGGHDFSGLCQKYKCMFAACPPANDRWNPWPFLRRMWDAAMALGTEYTIMLEPDNSLHRGFLHEPPHDAGGMEDANPHFHEETVDYAELLGRKHRPNFRWNFTGSGLAGGSYFRTSAILDAFSDAAINDIDWDLAECYESKRLYSSDFAMPIVLAARGYRYEPWRDITQYELDCCTKVRQPMAAAIEHYGRSYPNGKPPYRLEVQEEDKDLFTIKNWAPKVTCQGCYDRDEYYKRWGSLNCTNRLYEQNRWVRTERAEGKPRRCNKEEHDRAVGYLNGLLGGADAAKGMHRERKERESANLQERLMGAAKANQKLEAYFAVSKTAPPPTYPNTRMKGLPELPPVPPSK
eukprot:m.130683 g.130683  ORF g.130683 m.130683 type:complete len:434 (+) comp22374_c0_seq2:345-1646(+)